MVFTKDHIVGFDPCSSSRFWGFITVSLRTFTMSSGKFCSCAIHVLIPSMAGIPYLNTRELPRGQRQPFGLCPFR